jgi:hypothetical protein
LTVTAVSVVVGLVAEPSDNWGELPVLVSFTAVGLLLTLRRPDNVVGWLFGGMAVVTAVAFGAQNVARSGVSRPVADWAAWLGTWPIGLAGLFFFLPIVFFPDGRLPSRRWRIPVGVVAVASAVDCVTAFLGDALTSRNFPRLHDPVQVIPPATAKQVQSVFESVQLWWFVLAVVAVALRLHRSRGVEREQLKWFLFATGVSATAMVVLGMAPLGVDPLVGFQIAVPFIPCAVGVAILRYRLYDIDRLVSRTVSWVVVSGLLVAVYLATVTLATRALPVSSSYGVAASTLAAAALFQPVRRRVQDAVDRRFDRARFDATRTVDWFAARVRDHVDIDAVRADLLGVVGSTIAPAHASLWLATPRDGT